MKFLNLFLTLMLLASCSSHRENKSKKDKKSTKDILKEFKVDDKVIEKYEVKDVPPPVTPPSSKTPVAKNPVVVVPGKRVVPTPARVPPPPTPVKKPAVKIGKRDQLELAEFAAADKVTIGWWNQFKPKIIPGEKLYMDMNYLGMTTGTIILETKANTVLGTEPVYQLHSELTSSNSYRWIYEMDNTIDSFVRMKDFHPKKYTLTQRESAQSVDDVQLFDSEAHRVMWFYERSTKAKKEKKQRSFSTPVRFQDPLSVLSFIRGLPLTKGVTYSVPVINKSKLLTLDATTEDIENLETDIGTFDTLRVHVQTQYTGESLKSGDMTFWFTNDEKRIFVKVKAKIKIGNVTGHITKYE